MPEGTRPFELSTHDRCSDPCPQFRERIEGSSKVEFVGFWGPYLETADGERIAEGHEEVGALLDDLLDDRS